MTTERTFTFRRLAALTGGLIALLVVVPGTASAQVGAGWSALLGCWNPLAEAGAVVGTDAQRALCVLPGPDAATVELATVVDGAITQRETLDASGVRREFERDGCVGWE